MFQIEIFWNLVNWLSRRNCEFCESTISENAKRIVETSNFTKMWIWVLAMVTLVTSFIRINSHLVTNSDTCYGLSDLNNNTAGFMTGNKFVTNISDVTMENVTIRTTDATVIDFDLRRFIKYNESSLAHTVWVILYESYSMSYTIKWRNIPRTSSGFLIFGISNFSSVTFFVPLSKTSALFELIHNVVHF